MVSASNVELENWAILVGPGLELEPGVVGRDVEEVSDDWLAYVRGSENTVTM